MISPEAERLIFIARQLVQTKPRGQWADVYQEFSEIFALYASLARAGYAGPASPIDESEGAK